MPSSELKSADCCSRFLIYKASEVSTSILLNLYSGFFSGVAKVASCLSLTLSFFDFFFYASVWALSLA